MKVFGVSERDVYDVVHRVSHNVYDGNLVVKDSADQSNSRGPRSRFTLQVLDSHRGRPGVIGVPGHKGNGPHGMKRRSNAACWHAHWDVIEELLNTYPAARVYSGFRLRDVAVVYTADTFRDTALATAHLDVGTARSGPVTMPQCCDCDHTRYSDIPPEVDHTLSEPAYRPGHNAASSAIPSWMPGSHARAIHRHTAHADDIETSYAATNGGQHEPHADLSGYSYRPSNWGSADTARSYPWDAIPAARPWVKPGSAGVGDTLALIDEITADDNAAPGK